ncbi:MAG TPA: energy transducer TonB [Allosphingosinicella sp.]
MTSAGAAAAFHLLLGYALIGGLGVEVSRQAEERLKLFEVREAPPPPEVKAAPAPKLEKATEAAAAPAAPAASPVLAPPPEVRVEAAPPLPAAPVVGSGVGVLAGSSSGSGVGTGSGGAGSSTGSGGGGGVARSARLIGGALLDSDYPRAARRKRAEGVVFLSFKVAADGGVSDCIVTRSSGHAELDATTCRLIERRFRYAPALDAEGKKVPDLVVGRHAWWIGRRRPGGAGTEGRK